MKQTQCVKQTVNSRKLWVLQGESSTLFNQLSNFRLTNAGDWITVTSQLSLASHFNKVIDPNKTKSLLGREFKHAIFDATQGFNLDAFAALTGTLIKGSLLVLLLPNNLTHFYDNDSLRWNQNDAPINVPNFINHLLAAFERHALTINPITETTATVIDTDLNQILPYIAKSQNTSQTIDTLEQQALLMQLCKSDKAIMAVIAKRGRGKSALAGLFTHHYHCIVTAPNKDSLNTFFKFAEPSTSFYAPDELIASHTNNDINLAKALIIDEAAMIPLSLLEALLSLPYRILLTTTTDGYEGTGQGFLLKLLKNRDVDYFQLTSPIRWENGDLLEAFTDDLLLNGTITKLQTTKIDTKLINYSMLSHHDLVNLKSIYYLLKSAHYRTTTTDLRRLLDAENTTVWQARLQNDLIAALVAINEGGLADKLIDAVWQGTRRPKGNLVAQSLVAHAGEKLAAKLTSIRINRITVSEPYRRKKIAYQLINQLFKHATEQNKDFLSVSFAYSRENTNFWQNCGFIIIHVASHKEASSGTYSVMAIKAISQQGRELAKILQIKLQRNWPWLKEIIYLELDITIDYNQQLTAQDRQELHGFALHYRPFEASYPALCRLNLMLQKIKQSRDICPIFNALINQKHLMQQVIAENKLTGRQKLIGELKSEVNKILANVL